MDRQDSSRWVGCLVVGLAGALVALAPRAAYAQQQDGRTQHGRLCFACHGAGVKRDGPASKALSEE